MRILVIEDEPDLPAVLQQILRDEGYAVDTALDGNEGLQKAQSWEYDAVVLDLMLPGIDGWTLLSELRRTKVVPVLILSAKDALGDRVQGLDLGADDYLVKPFARTELLARLRALIRRSAGQADSVIEIGDVTIDVISRTVKKQGQSVNLTGREYALVEYLALHRGQLVTRTMLYDHLFDENDDSLSNLLDAHVSNIRKKLGKDFVVTRRGQGYAIDV